ncbi:hypothetical protein Ciccas_012660, partial [Cichlidogyrus casuarinus]
DECAADRVHNSLQIQWNGSRLVCDCHLPMDHRWGPYRLEQKQLAQLVKAFKDQDCEFQVSPGA